MLNVPLAGKVLTRTQQGAGFGRPSRLDLTDRKEKGAWLPSRHPRRQRHR